MRRGTLKAVLGLGFYGLERKTHRYPEIEKRKQLNLCIKNLLFMLENIPYSLSQNKSQFALKAEFIHTIYTSKLDA